MTQTSGRALPVLILAAAVVAALAAYFGLLRPVRAKPADIRVAATAERIARGRYLYTLADCDGCHAERDFSRFAGPVPEERRGQGSVIPAEFGLPGVIAAPNITPHPEAGLGRWSDGEKIRAIRDGIGRDGRALYPLMPYRDFRHMSDSDIESLVAYLNTLPPARTALPRSRIDFPASVLIRTEPRPAGRVPHPDPADPVAYGEYLATIAHCAWCHTPEERGKPKESMRFAGGRQFRLHGGLVVSANITPDSRTGIGAWSEGEFLARFYQYRKYLAGGPPSVGPEGFTLMPWLNYSQIPPEDLKAIWQFLRTRKPVENTVETRPVPRMAAR